MKKDIEYTSASNIFPLPSIEEGINKPIKESKKSDLPSPAILKFSRAERYDG